MSIIGIITIVDHHIRVATTNTAEVGFLALVALEVGEVLPGPRDGRVVVLGVGRDDAGMIQQTLDAQSLDVARLERIPRLLQGRDLRREELVGDGARAQRAVEEAVADGGGGPLVLEPRFEAVRVEDVAARELEARRLLERLDVADGAEVAPADVERDLRAAHGAAGLEARAARRLALGAVAEVPAGLGDVAAARRLLHAGVVRADGGGHGDGGVVAVAARRLALLRRVAARLALVERVDAAADAEARVTQRAHEAVLQRVVPDRGDLDAVEDHAARRAYDAALHREAHLVHLEGVPLVGRKQRAQLVRPQRRVAARGGARALVRRRHRDLGVVAGARGGALDAHDVVARFEEDDKTWRKPTGARGARFSEEIHHHHLLIRCSRSIFSSI